MELILSIHEQPLKFFDILAKRLVELDSEGLSSLKIALGNKHEQAVLVEIENT